MITRLLKKIFSFLFPSQCIVCGSEEVVCNICMTCSKTAVVNRDVKRPWLFSLYRYKDEKINICIRHLKSFPDQEMVEQLFQEKKFMIHHWISGITQYYNVSHILLVPVPLHNNRYIERGYNQAEIIAQALQKIAQESIKNISIEINTAIIIKSKKTNKQALIHDRTLRKENIKNAFSIQKDRNIKHLGQSLVIIIDDVTTTGGTMDEIKSLIEPYAPTFAFTLAH